MGRRPRLTAPGARTPDRDHLLDRLHQLRKLVPAFAEELGSARRETATLRLEYRRLLDQVRRLQREHGRTAHGTRRPGCCASRTDAKPRSCRSSQKPPSVWSPSRMLSDTARGRRPPPQGRRPARLPQHAYDRTQRAYDRSFPWRDGVDLRLRETGLGHKIAS